ncbi:MAG: type II secretion system protein [bacterium]|nr:type II secretion system protein [bacterium]MDY4101067.1 type II secretion system protein [Lachnospiraceae bacterium]
MRSNIRKDPGENNKGFTLVELIVVLVILAILAAILVPALLGYIDRAKSSQDILNAKNLYTAAQTVASEYYARGETIDISADGGNYAKDVVKISDLSNEDFSYGVIGFEKESPASPDPHAKWTVALVVYYNKRGEGYYMETGNTWKNCAESDFSDVYDEFGGKYDLTGIYSLNRSP